MSGILLKKKNNKYRFIKDKNYLKKLISSYVVKDRYLPKEVSLNVLSKKNSLKNSSISKIKNKCLISGRNRSVYKKYRTISLGKNNRFQTSDRLYKPDHCTHFKTKKIQDHSLERAFLRFY